MTNPKGKAAVSRPKQSGNGRKTKWVQLDLYDLYAYERHKEITKCDRSTENPSTSSAAHDDSKSKSDAPKPPTRQCEADTGSNQT